ncbi:hypothetical protein M0804_013908 [Polistes exclamans]|nr:hypothetical protein M0804_013908 [Polistes exclamans]
MSINLPLNLVRIDIYIQDIYSDISIYTTRVLFNFLREDLNPSIKNDQAVPIIRHVTTIKAVFIRHLDNISTRQFVSYFSYHKSLIPHMSIESQPDQLIDEN